MESLIETLRLALAPEATDEQRAAGADACRTILPALEPSPAPSAPVGLNVHAIANAIGMLRGLPPDQLLDVAIMHLRTITGAKGVGVPEAPRPLAFQLVPIPGK